MIPLATYPSLHLSSHSDIGLRKYMEDRLDIREINDNLLLVTICDGHGGHECAEFAIHHFPHHVEEYFKMGGKPLASLNYALKTVNKEWDKKCFGNRIPRNLRTRTRFFQAQKEDKNTSGTTIVSCIINAKKKKAYILNLGDSRAQWSYSHKIGSTFDQKPDPETIDKITKFPAWIDNKDIIFRLNGDLAIGSCLGDNSENLTGCVGRKPSPYTVDYTSGDLKLILASDGLWDEEKAQDLFSLPGKDCSAFTKSNTDDNITIVYIQHKHKKIDNLLQIG
jgi:serine/threonine protein phosphatase PrpC